jgi:hypothetical protein
MAEISRGILQSLLSISRYQLKLRYSNFSYLEISHLYLLRPKQEQSESTGWSKSLCEPDDYNNHTIYDLKMAFTEYIRNEDRAIVNTVFENTVRRVNKCLLTGGGHFGHYL